MIGVYGINMDRYDDLIVSLSRECGVDPVLIKAIAIRESGVDPTAHRNEPGFYRRYIAGSPRWSKHRYAEVPQIIAAAFGMMQVQYTTALWMGFPDDLDWWQLFCPEWNICMGIQWYLNRFAKYDNQSIAISAYNCGSPVMVQGQFKNHSYVDEVQLNMTRVRADWADRAPGYLE